jgi:hypothetical protein
MEGISDGRVQTDGRTDLVGTDEFETDTGDYYIYLVSVNNGNGNGMT